MPDLDLMTRIVCVLFAAVTLIMLAARWREWVQLPRRLFLYGIGLAFMVLSVGYGVVEGIVTGAPGGPRFVLVATALGLLALASLIPSDHTTRRNR